MAQTLIHRCLLGAIVLLVGTYATGAEAREPRRGQTVPRKTGNLSILSYRAPLMKGQRPEPLDPMLRDPQALRTIGMGAVEDYVTLDVVEPAKGRTHFDPYLANAVACRRLGLRYAVYPWVHFYPDWVTKEKGFTPYTNLEDGTTCRQPSGWAPFTKKLVSRFYTTLAEGLGNGVAAVYVTDCAEYGELGYPNGYTKWLRKDDNAKPAWWCGDRYARSDFRREMLRRYRTRAGVNEAWGTGFKKPDEITYPSMALLRSNPDPRKLTPQQRRHVLDFVYWYQDASPRRVREYLRIVQRAFPSLPYEVKLGHGDESAMLGHSYSSACRLLKSTPRLSIRSTHAAVSYFHVKRVSTPAHYYRLGFLTEPSGTMKPERMAERIFTDACAGVNAYFDYPQNPPAAGESYTKNIGLLDFSAAEARVALFFPEANHYLRIDRSYPDGLLACANAIRDVADYDVIDERLIADGILPKYRVLVIVGDPLIEDTTARELNKAFTGDYPPTLIQVVPTDPATPAGVFAGVDGQPKRLDTPRRGKHSDHFMRLITPPDGDAVVQAVQKAYGEFLTESGMKEAKVAMLTARDGVWTGLFVHRILAYNPSDEPRTIGKKPIAGREILEFRGSH